MEVVTGSTEGAGKGGTVRDVRGDTGREEERMDVTRRMEISFPR